jgi:hypothetical protein
MPILSLEKTAKKTIPIILYLLTLSITALPSIAMGSPKHDLYQLHFAVDLTRTDGYATAQITVSQQMPLLREVRLRAPADLYANFSGDGAINREGAVVTWQPPPHGGSIKYVVLIDHQRTGGGFDALFTENWALFRGDDVFPPASISQRPGTRASSKFSTRLPENWSIVTPFTEDTDGHLLIDNPERNFARPVGWIIAGRLGVRRDLIAGMDISVAGPLNSGIERIGMLALLRWTLPLLAAEIESLPPHISIVSAGEPMWRGGLSAPNSLYIHADRPLLSENATSTLLHEMIHVLMPIATTGEHDWIDEGIAEYVTLKILYRSGTISAERFTASIRKFADRGQAVDSLLTTRASGAITSRAVTIFHNIDNELQSLTDGHADIFSLIHELMACHEPIDITDLRSITTQLTGGQPLTALQDSHIPGVQNP